MCWRCDHPDASYEDYYQLVRETIDRCGWFIQAVERDRRRPGLAYTVGLTRLGLAELLVTGLSQRRAGDLLNSVTTHMVRHDGGSLEAGEKIPLRGGPTIEVVALSAPTVHLVTAVELYGPEVVGQQLVYTDDRGHWPWHLGFRGKQPVLGPRVIDAA